MPTTICGVIESNGSIQSGTNFSSANNSKGNYTVTFNEPFNHTPAVVAQVYQDPPSGDMACIVVSALSTSHFSVQIRSTNSQDEYNIPFTFIAMETAPV